MNTDHGTLIVDEDTQAATCNAELSLERAMSNTEQSI